MSEAYFLESFIETVEDVLISDKNLDSEILDSDPVTTFSEHLYEKITDLIRIETNRLFKEVGCDTTVQNLDAEDFFQEPTFNKGADYGL